MSNIKIVGNHEQKTIDQLKRCVDKDGSYGVLCADGHLGYAQPVGGVVAYKNAVSISGVGFDISCGTSAVKLNVKLSDIKSNLSTIADDIQKNISFGVGKTNTNRTPHDLFDNDDAWSIPEVSKLKQLARDQLGTVGSGNHYVDVFADENENIWVGVHFGSRGLGHKIATYFLKEAGGKDGIEVDPAIVTEGTLLGDDYIAAMKLAGRYAYAGREYVVNKVASIIGGNIIDSVHNHHNFAWSEEHFGEKYWVVRKGATPAFPGQRGFVGGSMGDISVILEGLDLELSKELLYSTVHGAGRIMTRTEAAGRIKWKKGVKTVVKEGKISEKEMREKIKNKGIELRGAGADESPEVYGSLNEVLDFHSNTIKINTVLTPHIVVMAGGSDFDPYKD